MSKRPWHQRVWFYAPQWYFNSWSPVRRGCDEFDWHTFIFGWAVTGRLAIATRRCDCESEYPLAPDWPVGYWGDEPGVVLDKDGSPK